MITKIVYRYPSGQRNSVLVDIKWTAKNNTKIINLVTDLSELMRERNVDLAKAHLKKVLVLFYLECQIYLIKFKNYFYPNGYFFVFNLTAIIAALYK